MVGAITTLVVIFAAWYLLWMFQRVMFEQPKPNSAGFRDLDWMEVAGLVPLVALSIFMGVYPACFLEITRGADDALFQKVMVSRHRPEVYGVYFAPDSLIG